jgi:hypothetical protein
LHVLAGEPPLPRARHAERLDDRPPPRDEISEELRRLVRKGTDLGLCRLDEMRDGGGVDRIGLGALASMSIYRDMRSRCCDRSPPMRSKWIDTIERHRDLEGDDEKWTPVFRSHPALHLWNRSRS